MKEMNARGLIFFNRWKKHRTKKWQYAFIHGSICWGLPVAIIFFLLNNHFQVDQMLLPKFLIVVIGFGIGGFFYGLNQYKRIDEIYMRVNDDEDIESGIEDLKSGKTWNYENLIINKIHDKTLLVKNELFWFEDSEVTVDKMNECFNLVMNDFQRLKKNSAFNEFTNDFEIRLQIFDNSEKVKPLIDKII